MRSGWCAPPLNSPFPPALAVQRELLDRRPPDGLFPGEILGETWGEKKLHVGDQFNREWRLTDHQEKQTRNELAMPSENRENDPVFMALASPFRNTPTGPTMCCTCETSASLGWLFQSSWIIQFLVLEILLKPKVAIEKSSMASLIWLFPAKKAFISSQEISCGDCPASDYPRVTNRLILKMAVYSWFTYSI